MRMTIGFLAGIIVGMLLVSSAYSAGDGWSQYQINQVVDLLEQIARNTGD